MDTKALIIDTSNNGLQGTLGSWQDATTSMGLVTPNIVTPDVQDSDEEGAASIAAAIPACLLLLHVQPFLRVL